MKQQAQPFPNHDLMAITAYIGETLDKAGSGAGSILNQAMRSEVAMLDLLDTVSASVGYAIVGWHDRELAARSAIQALWFANAKRDNA